MVERNDSTRKCLTKLRQTKVLKGIDFLQIQDQDEMGDPRSFWIGEINSLNVSSGLEKVDEGHIHSRTRFITTSRDAH